MRKVGKCMYKNDHQNFTQLLGTRILDERQKRHFTQEQLAEMAEITPRYLYNLEQGKSSPSAYVLYLIAHALNVSMDYLVSDNYPVENDQWNPFFLHFDINERKNIIQFLNTLIFLLEKHIY